MVLRASIVRVLALVPLGAFACCITEPWEKDMPPAAGVTPLALGWSETAAWPDRAHDVYGVRLGASSRHHAVVGLDVNAIGVTDAASGGLAFALLRNEARDEFFGVQCALGWNNVTPLFPETAPNTLWGAQVALVSNIADVNGLQVAAWNGIPHTHDDEGTVVHGAQVGLVDAAGEMCGLQCAGLCAWAGTSYGVQVAPWNVAREVRGLQIGLFNTAKGGGLQLGLLNWNERGLLPVFPLLNFSVR